MQFGKQWNVSSALHSHHTPTRRVAMCNNNNKHCYEALDRGLKQRFYAMCHPLYYLPSHLVALEGHEVALDIWDVHEVFLPALIPEEAVAPRPAEVRHRARLHLALRTRGAYYLVLSIVCAQLWIHFCGTMVSLEFSSYTSPIFSAHFSLMQHFKDILCSILLQHTITMFVLHKPQTHKGVLCPVCVSNKTHLQPNRVIDFEFRNKDLCVFLPISCGYKKLRRKGVFRKCINSKHSMLPARKLGCIKPTKKWHENHESSSLLDSWIVCSTFIVILD